MFASLRVNRVTEDDEKLIHKTAEIQSTFGKNSMFKIFENKEYKNFHPHSKDKVEAFFHSKNGRSFPFQKKDLGCLPSQGKSGLVHAPQELVRLTPSGYLHC